MRKGNTTTWQHVDALGTPVATSNASGALVERKQYTPYGGSIGAATDGVGYTGHVMDAATGLTYMQQRYMDPELGMFLSVDPVTAYQQPVGQFNRYRYGNGNGNPYKFTDPNGRIACVFATDCRQDSQRKGIIDRYALADSGESSKPSKWSGIFGAWRGAVAHRIIEGDIALNLDGRVVQKERSVKTSRGRGKLDLMILGNDGVWNIFEIKPVSQMPSSGHNSSASAQLASYVQGLKDEGLKAKPGVWSDFFGGSNTQWVNKAPMIYGGALFGGSYVYGPSEGGDSSGIIYYQDGPNALINSLE